METKYREGASSGAWCALLLPQALGVTYLRFLNGDLSSFALAFSLGLYSVLAPINSNYQNFTNGKINKDPFIWIIIGLSGLVQLFTLPIVTTVSNLLALASYIHFQPKIFSAFPNSFTYGEGCVVLQSLFIFLTKSRSIMDPFIPDLNSLFRSEIAEFTLIGNVGLLSLLGMSLLPSATGIKWTTPRFLVTGFSIIGFVTVPLLWIRLNANPIFWIINSIFTSRSKIGLIAIWLPCIFVSVLLVIKQVSGGSRATTVIRKYFHLMVVIVFSSGVYMDVEFLYLSSVIILAVQILLEYIRISQIDPLSSYLNQAFEIFLDEKDSGSLVLTNIYLLAGVSLPLWLAPDLRAANSLVLLSGVLAIGVGDSMASVVGSKFGKVKFPGSNKTVEGTLASIAAQILFAFCVLGGGLNFGFIFSIVVVAFVEALTDQVDNIVLPLFLYSMLTYFT